MAYRQSTQYVRNRKYQCGLLQSVGILVQKVKIMLLGTVLLNIICRLLSAISVYGVSVYGVIFFDTDFSDRVHQRVVDEFFLSFA